MRMALSGWAVVLVLVPASTRAGYITYSNALNSSSPTFNRPVDNGDLPPTDLSTIGTTVFYHAQAFSVNVSNMYTLEVIGPSADFDSYLVLYETAFDPVNPLLNVLRANDDGPNGLLSQINVGLTAGVTYLLVTSTFDNGTDSFPDPSSGTVTFTNQLGNDVPGNTVTLASEAVVPEPSSVVLLGAGALSVLGYRCRRKRAG